MPYRGERYPLTEEDKSYFLARYGVPAREVYDSGTGWYLFDVKDAEGARTGVLKRRPDPIAPLYTGDYGDAPKSILYRETTDAPLAFHLHAVRGRRRYSAPIVAVEDVISSMKLCYMGIDSVALLGVGLSDDKVAALQSVTENLIIALDADATGQAFALARKYGPAFDRCRVMLLNKDIKDDSHNDFLAQYLRLEPSHVPCALP
jgi:DNA primase